MTVELLSGANDQAKIEQLIDELVGTGINLIDSSVQGDINGDDDESAQFGLFVGSEDLELPSPSDDEPFSGVIFSTGNVLGALGPNDLDNTGIDVGSAGEDGDDDLSNILDGSATNDAAILEFSFTVSKPSVFNFSYIFASEEYNEFVNSSFNDVFAFFLGTVGEDGEIIYGDSPDPTIEDSIATIPIQQGGTVREIPVAINNLNGLTTELLADGNPVSGLYNDNDLSDVAPEDLKNIEYDGFSNILSANTEELTPGTTYHFKITIADVSDSIYDSAVFIGGISADPVFAQDDFFPGPIDIDSDLELNVLDNDTFSPGNFKGITKINDQSIAIGGSIVLDSGAMVTLDDNGTDAKNDDFLVYEPAGDFSDTDSFTYSIKSGKNEASALVAILGENTVLGTTKPDNLNGSEDGETIYGFASRDKINGGGGDDRLIGADIIYDSKVLPTDVVDPDPDDLANGELGGGFGQGERDVLTGGEGADVFVLGSRLFDDFGIVFYNDGKFNSGVDKDFARIADFEEDVDQLELAGTSDDYFVQGSNLYYDLNDNGILNKKDELIAKFSGGVSIELDTDAIFV
jgi:hypothetical protein